ncbi:hypothetical protein WJX79_009235 [Trebouxia sp. C0005]
MVTAIAIPWPATPEFFEDRVTTVWVLYNVYVAFEDPEAAIKAQKALHRRIFGNNKIDASYYNEAWMEQKLFF